MIQFDKNKLKEQILAEQIEFFIQYYTETLQQNYQKEEPIFCLSKPSKKQLTPIKQMSSDQTKIKEEQLKQQEAHNQSYVEQMYEGIINQICNQNIEQSASNQGKIIYNKEKFIMKRQQQQKCQHREHNMQIPNTFKIRMINNQDVELNKHSQDRLDYLSINKFPTIRDEKYDNQKSDTKLAQYYITKKQNLKSQRKYKEINSNKGKQYNKPNKTQRNQFKINKQCKERRSLEKQAFNTDKAVNHKKIQIRNTLNRFLNFNKFDISSCEISLLHSGNKKLSKIHKRIKQHNFHKQKKEDFPEVDLLKSRINKFGSEIQVAIPYLKEMGVKLQKINALR